MTTFTAHLSQLTHSQCFRSCFATCRLWHCI